MSGNLSLKFHLFWLYNVRKRDLKVRRSEQLAHVTCQCFVNKIVVEQMKDISFTIIYSYNITATT